MPNISVRYINRNQRKMNGIRLQWNLLHYIRERVSLWETTRCRQRPFPCEWQNWNAYKLISSNGRKSKGIGLKNDPNFRFTCSLLDLCFPFWIRQDKTYFAIEMVNDVREMWYVKNIYHKLYQRENKNKRNNQATFRLFNKSVSFYYNIVSIHLSRTTQTNTSLWNHILARFFLCCLPLALFRFHLIIVRSLYVQRFGFYFSSGGTFRPFL